jgi:hypothetical protein
MGSTPNDPPIFPLYFSSFPIKTKKVLARQLITKCLLNLLLKWMYYLHTKTCLHASTFTTSFTKWIEGVRCMSRGM